MTKSPKTNNYSNIRNRFHNKIKIHDIQLTWSKSNNSIKQEPFSFERRKQEISISTFCHHKLFLKHELSNHYGKMWFICLMKV